LTGLDRRDAQLGEAGRTAKVVPMGLLNRLQHGAH
jgi:hypothetical protein